MGFLDSFTSRFGDTFDVARERVVGGVAGGIAGAFEAASGAVGDAYSRFIDRPEPPPEYGLAPGGVVPLNQRYYDSRGTLRPREIVTPPAPTARSIDADQRNAPGVAANLGEPGTFPTLFGSPVTLALLGVGLVAGGAYLLRR